MSDVAFGPGFEAPDYGDVLDRLNKSGNPELEKVSQILATAQMMHSTLSGFESYKDFTDGISKAYIDPLKQQISSALDDTSATLGKFVNAGNNALPGVSADLLKSIKSPDDLLKAGKGVVRDLKTGGKGPLKSGKQKLAKIAKQAEQAVEDVKKGKVPTLDTEGLNINSDVTDFFKSGMGDILPELPDLPGLDVIGKTVQDARATLSESESLLKSMPDQLNAALDKQLGKLSSKTVSSLRQAGLTDADIKTNLLSPQKIQQFSSVDYENPMRNMRMMQFDQPDIFAENFNPKDFIKSYNTKFGRAPSVNEGKGLLKGDSDLSTKTIKDTLNKTPAEAQQIVEDANKIPADTVKLSKRALKTRARTAKQSVQEDEAGPAPEAQASPKPPAMQPTEPGSVARPSPVSEIQPAESQLAQEGESATQDLANTATSTESILTQQANKVGNAIGSTVDDVTNSINKAKSILSDVATDTEGLDVTPIGDLIEGALGIATLGTMIAGLFDPPAHQTTLVSGEQLGV